MDFFEQARVLLRIEKEINARFHELSRGVEKMTERKLSPNETVEYRNFIIRNSEAARHTTDPKYTLEWMHKDYEGSEGAIAYVTGHGETVSECEYLIDEEACHECGVASEGRDHTHGDEGGICAECAEKADLIWCEGCELWQHCEDFPEDSERCYDNLSMEGDALHGEMKERYALGI